MNAEKSILHIKINYISDTCWSVKSQGDKIYSIRKEQACSCPLKCFYCSVCTHMYSCTCLDNLLHCTACKHIHLLHMQLNRKNIQTAPTEQAINCGELPTASTNSEAFDLLDIPVNNHASVSETALGACKEIVKIIPNVTNTSVLRSTNKKMQAILLLL